MISIITAEQRLSAPRKTNIAVLGPSGVGKTTLARSLDPATTLFVNLEAGDLALGDWPGDSIDIRREAAKLGAHPWWLSRALACVMCGPDPAASNDWAHPTSAYGAAAFQQYAACGLTPDMFAKYRTIFWDSITVAGRHSFAWSQTQPDAVSEKTGKYDGRGAYGRHGQEMVTWLTTIQHTPDKSTIVVGILNVDKDDFGRTVYRPQIDGGKTGAELPGIFDEVLTLGLFTVAEGKPALDMAKGSYRGFVCHLNNGYGVPAKDRSGCLDLIEPPDLGALMRKIAAGKRHDGTPVTGMPT